jgi:predicted Zn-dependent protease
MTYLALDTILTRRETRPAGRFLSEQECASLAKQVAAVAVGGGSTNVFISSSWTGNLRWARNMITTCGDVRDNYVGVDREIRGAEGAASINQIDQVSLEAAVRRAERLLIQMSEDLESPLYTPYTEPYQSPKLWFDTTYKLDADARAAAMRELVKPTVDAGMLAAGYIQVAAYGRAAMSDRGRAIYYPLTQAQYSVTVRDPEGTASGWAGVDWNDWSRIDAKQLSAIALHKCLTSRNPVALEPGRYTTILEPQAVSDLVSQIFDDYRVMDRRAAEEARPPQPFSGSKRGETKIGEQVFDERITISADPMDPDLGFLPIDVYSASASALTVYHPATWFENGVLKELAYVRQYGIEQLGVNTGLPNSRAFKMSGGPTSIDEMIATTKRGILVTRFSDVAVVDELSMLCTGYTRDGLWLIENGKISKPIKNFRFTESPFFVLNNVEQIGKPQRVFRPAAPAVVPPLKVSDFSFTSLADAI